jgi:DNA-binding GntR family transcriptional regulator
MSWVVILDYMELKRTTLSEQATEYLRAAILEAELELHSLAYEATRNTHLLQVWRGLRAKLQLYWATQRDTTEHNRL